MQRIPYPLYLAAQRQYSHFFCTLYDEQSYTAGLNLPRGLHHSILRAVVCLDSTLRYLFHDFAVLWDEDHDERVIWVAEQLFMQRLLQHVIVLAEAKGHVSVVPRVSLSTKIETHVMESLEQITKAVPNDSFTSELLTVIPRRHEKTSRSPLIEDNRTVSYLQGVVGTWTLGTKPVVATADPFQSPA
jgi:hypothetical protein